MHVYSCAKKDANARTKALLDQQGPVTDPCTYQRCGHGAQFKTFVPCGETFNTQKEKGVHMRDHMRAMTKAGPSGKVLSCFFGSCARNPEGGRLRRDGPDFESTEELQQHLWERHGLSTLKKSEASYCLFCNKFLIKPSEYRYHAAQHIDDASSLIERIGYTGEFAGRCIAPAICPFCYYDETLAPADRLSPLTTVFSFRKHIEAHLSALTASQTCPFCYYDERLYPADRPR